MSRFMGYWRNYVMEATDAPTAYVEASGLMALSTLALGHRDVKAGRGIAPALFMLLIGDSTNSRKSTCIRRTKWVVDAVAPHLIGPNDYTMEGLYKWMQRKDVDTQKPQSRVLLIHEEFAQVLTKAQQGAYNSSFKGDMCSLYDGEDIVKARSMGTTTVAVKQPRINLFAGCSYEFLGQGCNKADWLSGFMVRFLYVHPQGARPSFPEFPEDPRDKFDVAASALANIYAELKHTSGTALPVTPAATRMLVDLDAECLENATGSAFTEHELVVAPAYARRFALNVRKLALLYQIDRDPHAPIDVGAVDDAIKYSMWALWGGFKKGYEVTTSKDYEAGVRWAVKAGKHGVTNREVYKQFFGNEKLPQQVIHFIRKSGYFVRETNNGGEEVWRLEEGVM